MNGQWHGYAQRIMLAVLVTPAGLAEIMVVWLVWLSVLPIPAISAAVTIAGLGLLGPVAAVSRVRSGHWPRWAPRIFRYAFGALAIGIPFDLLLLKIVTE